LRERGGVNAQPLALGVDLGTGSARAFVFDGAGARLGGARRAYTWRSAVDGTVEADADAIVDLVFSTVDDAVATLTPRMHVAAVGISALWHTLLGVDAAGAPATPVYAWSDTRATAAAARLRKRLDPGAVHARTGAVLHPSFPPAKLLWLREHDPAGFARVARWLSLPEYLWFRLTGDYAADLSMAAGSGLVDQERLAWDEELLDACGVAPARLGRIAAGHEEAATAGSNVAAAHRWPPLQTALWRMPAGDGACAALGSGCHDRTRTALSIGTSAALRVLTDDAWAPPPAGLWRYRLDRRRSLTGAAISNGGVVRSWMRSMLALPADPTAIDSLLAAREPAAHGLAMLPFLAGERSPDWPLHATAALAGMRLATSALDLLQAAMESVTYRLAMLRARLLQAVPQATTIVASGGALRESPYWAQLLADAFGEPLRLAADPETSARGAAILALEAAGATDALRSAAVETTIVEPDMARYQLHAAALRRHRALQRRMR
jgi:gluconokinase